MKLPQLSVTLRTAFTLELAMIRRANAGITLQTNYADTGCSYGTGVVSTTYNMRQVQRYGPPDCLIAHENEHVNYASTCCARAKICVDNSADGGAQCNQAFRQWQRQTLNDDECRAYNREIACLQQAIASGRYNDEATTMLNARLADAQYYSNYYCSRVRGPVPGCPFDALGNIA